MDTHEARHAVLLRSEQSDGHVAVIEGAVPAHWDGPPLHRHDHDEGFYVLEGEVTFEVDGKRLTARPGEFAFAPGGSRHALANLSDAPARYVLVCTPGGFERYFDRITAEQTGSALPPESLKPYSHSTVVGPPIGQREAAD
jgi:mannose-6-phosphate isomerase-like protein (cupin superfamily)